MTREELNRVLDLENKAGRLLVWLAQQARQDPTAWNEENFEAWSCTDLCVDILWQARETLLEAMKNTAK